MIRRLQDRDRNSSFTRGNFPYFFENEPKSRSGKSQGLVLIIDKHSDLVAAGSNDAAFSGSFAFIGSSGTFPLTRQEHISILPGTSK